MIDKYNVLNLDYDMRIINFIMDKRMKQNTEDKDEFELDYFDTITSYIQEFEEQINEDLYHDLSHTVHRLKMIVEMIESLDIIRS